MEFKFRAVDDRTPASGSGFMAAQEMLGRNVRLSSDTTTKPTEDHVEAAILREIEKEQIRQEIIAAETARRRELVAEVMREMAMERQMAMRRGEEMGMSFEERLMMWINSRRSPYQSSLVEWPLASADPLRLTAPYNVSTSPMTQLQPFQQMPEVAAGAKVTPAMESNREKLIVLDRPAHSGAKRKAEALPGAGAGELHLLGLKKKPREEWSCALCKVSATCKRGFNEHLWGKKHKAKEAALRKEQMAKTSTTVNGRKKASCKRTCSGQSDGEKPVETAAGYKKNSRIKFRCEICNVGTLTKAVMRQHEWGKKHRARIQQQNGHPGAAPTSKPVSTTATAPASIAITAPPSNAVAEMVIDEVLLQKEKAKNAVLEDANEEVGETADKAVVVGTETTTECTKRRKFKFWCEICNVGAYSKRVMENHLLGRKHKARLEKQRCTLAVLNTGNAGLASSASAIVTPPAAAAAAVPVPSSNENAEDADAGEARLEDPTADEATEEDSIFEDVKGEYSSVEDQTAEERMVEGSAAEKASS